MGAAGDFKLCFSVAISPTSPYERRNWLYSADQDGDSELRGAEGLAERARSKGRGEGRVNSKKDS